MRKIVLGAPVSVRGAHPTESRGWYQTSVCLIQEQSLPVLPCEMLHTKALPNKRRQQHDKEQLKASKKKRGPREGDTRTEQTQNTKLSLKQGTNELGDGTTVHFFPKAMCNEDGRILRLLRDEVPWQQQEIQVMGRKVFQPRLIAYMADDESLSYTYSQTRQIALPWTPTVAEIKKQVEELSGAHFNSCLLNLYRGGRDSLSWHSDNEPVYGSTPTIGSASFGASRDFLLRKNADRSQRYSAALGCGDVLVMSGNCQRDWQHAVPKRAACSQQRINLTFRTIVVRE